MKYNFGYLILIMTGIYDNLAWIIKYIYKLNISRENVNIKIPVKLFKDHKKKFFLEKLNLQDKVLTAFISDDLTQKYIHLIYPIRDSLVHRTFFNSVYFSNKSKGIEKDLIKLPEIIYENFKEIHTDNINYLDSFILLDDGVYIEPYKFIEFLDEMFISTVNEILNKIDLNHLISKLSPKGKERIEQCFKNYNSGLYSFLNLNCKPIYF